MCERSYRPMNTPFLQRLMERLSGPRLLWVTLISLVPIAASFLPNSYIATVGKVSLERRFLAGAVFGYAVALSLFAVGYFDTRVREVGESLDDLTSRRAEGDLFAGYSSAIGPILLTAVFVVATVLRTVSLADLGTGLAWLPISVVTNIPLMSAFWIYVVVLLGLRRLSRLRLSLENFPEDPSLGLAPAGRLAYTAFWIFIAASAPALVVNAGYAVRLALSFGVFLVGIVIFFASVWGLHRQLLSTREEHIANARRLYAQAYEPIRSSSPDALARQADALLAAKTIEEEARLIQKWPFDDRRFKEIAAIVGTVVTFSGTGIITRLIYENVIL
jgi:hypothetical protein